MTRFNTVPYAAGLAAALMLSGCQGGSPDPTPSTTTTSQVTTSATAPATTTTTAPPTTTAGPAFPPGLPAAAKAHTKAGAKAFVAHFLHEFNAGWTIPDAQRIARLCNESTSRSCAAYVKTAEDLKTKGHRYRADPVSVERLIVLNPVDGRHRVDFQGHQERSSVVDASGRVVLTDPREPSHWMFFLDWGTGGWLVHDVKLVK